MPDEKLETLLKYCAVIEESYYLFAMINAKSQIWIDARSKELGSICGTANDEDVFDLVDSSPKLRAHLEDKGILMFFFEDGKLERYTVPGDLVA